MDSQAYQTVLSQLAAELEKQPLRPLSDLKSHLAEIQATGVYAIYYRGPCPDCQGAPGRPVYAGSAVDSPLKPGEGKRLWERLSGHRNSIAPTTLNVSDFSFRTLALPSAVAIGVEHTFINSRHPIWNGSGFGSNASGKGRPDQKRSVWDTRHPGRAGRGNK